MALGQSEQKSKYFYQVPKATALMGVFLVTTTSTSANG